MEGPFLNMPCMNASNEEEINNCFEHAENAANVNDEVEPGGYGESIVLVNNITYYLEGVILTPMSIVGLFGKFFLLRYCTCNNKFSLNSKQMLSYTYLVNLQVCKIYLQLWFFSKRCLDLDSYIQIHAKLL